MNHSIIGIGNLGTAIAKRFAPSSIPVRLANTRIPT